jgi:hypothetical protein
MPSPKRFTYAPSPVPTGIDMRLLDWLRREFQAVARGLQTIAETTVRYAYGHMVSASAQAIADITATWQQITQYGSTDGIPVGVIMDPVAGTFAVERAGTYVIEFYGILEHNEAQAERLLDLRIYDSTTGQGLTTGLPISVARSVTLSNVSGQAELQLAGRADVLWFEINSPDGFTGCSWQAKSLSVWSIGP